MNYNVFKIIKLAAAEYFQNLFEYQVDLRREESYKIISIISTYHITKPKVRTFMTFENQT